MGYPGTWAPGDSVGGPWTVSADSSGSATDDGIGSGLDLVGGGSGRELVRAGQSLGDLDLVVNLSSISQVDGVDSVEVVWHMSSPDTYLAFTIGGSGWQIVEVAGGFPLVLGAGSESVPAGSPASIEVSSDGGLTTVSLDGAALPAVFDGGSGDIGLGSANGAETTFLVVALSA
jgi:hypothetical protein